MAQHDEFYRRRDEEAQDRAVLAHIEGFAQTLFDEKHEIHAHVDDAIAHGLAWCMTAGDELYKEHYAERITHLVACAIADSRTPCGSQFDACCQCTNAWERVLRRAQRRLRAGITKSLAVRARADMLYRRRCREAEAEGRPRHLVAMPSGAL